MALEPVAELITNRPLKSQELQPVSGIVGLAATERFACKSDGSCSLLASRHLGQDSTQTIKGCIGGEDERPIKVWMCQHHTVEECAFQIFKRSRTCRGPILRSQFSEGASSPPTKRAFSTPLLPCGQGVERLCDGRAARDEMLIIQHHPKERFDLPLRWSATTINHEVLLTKS